MSETDPLARYRAGIARRQKADETELGIRINVETATRTVRYLGQRAITVVQRLGVEFPAYKGEGAVMSRKLPLGSIEDLSFALSFAVWVDYAKKLSADGETVTAKRMPRLKLPGRSVTPEEKLEGVLPEVVESWVTASDAHGNETHSKSEIVAPMNPAHFIKNTGAYAYSNVGFLDSSEVSRDASLGLDFMTVTGHVQTCIRKAEYELGIAPPSDETHLTIPSLEEVLAVTK